MFAITADQIDSRRGPDLGEEGLALLIRLGGEQLALPPDRTAGDEIQALTADARTALELVLGLARTREWSVGLGIGEVQTPLPAATRTTGGSAFISARTAVDAAKKRPLHVAVSADGGRRRPAAATLQSIVDLLLQLRERRSPEGWELFDLVESGLTQAEAAGELGITPQAASKRAIAAGTRIDAAARDGLVELLEWAGSDIDTPGGNA